MKTAVLREYIPASWFHPLGVFKVNKRLEGRLPNVAGKLHLTFTLDREKFSGPSQGFDVSRDKLRKVFYRLRKGIVWEGKLYRIDVPYCVKLEFHEDGWPHFHVIFLTRRFLPKELLDEVWGLGFTFVQRISDEDFRYLLKDVSKSGEAPEWILDRKRVRVFQSSRGFLQPVEKKSTEDGKTDEQIEKPVRHRAPLSSLGVRLDKWGKMALLDHGEKKEAIRFELPFREIFDHVVLYAACVGRYLGNRRIEVIDGREVILWQRMKSRAELDGWMHCQPDF